ncbi:Proline-rich receptor-like protein kinase PERK9 [Madurella mycetomatis]|uniref:Proline-rich receptor-like protein kinase PERK9 n=1 Tax=Madurella mycetomatis TaxID=100816 RepID=A0A175W8Y8_9PEZI|nr:Proline-rich receptor-like protein kinase PERK9 [Madurella mycetomatis]
MVYQSSDVATGPEPSTTASSETSGSLITTSNTSNLPPPSDLPVSEENPSSGLSTGAIIAIAVTIPIVVIGALVAGFFVWRRRRRQPQYEAAAPVPQTWHEPQYVMKPYPGVAEPVHEMPASGIAVEMDSNAQPSVELPGDYTQMGPQKPM